MSARKLTNHEMKGTFSKDTAVLCPYEAQHKYLFSQVLIMAILPWPDFIVRHHLLAYE